MNLERFCIMILFGSFKEMYFVFVRLDDGAVIEGNKRSVEVLFCLLQFGPLYLF